MGKIGVLALQGDFAAHQKVLSALGFETRLVRESADLVDLSGMVLPGGESSAQLSLLDRFELFEPLQQFGRQGKPVLTTCAGLILAAKTVINPSQKSLGWIDVTVSRNAWGRQLDSFEAVSDDQLHPLTFIRAPRITQLGSGVRVVATFQNEPVLVQQGAVWGATFHPELTTDLSIHQKVFGGCR